MVASHRELYRSYPLYDDLLKDWESRWKYVDDNTLSETVIANEQSVLQCTLDRTNLWCEENDISKHQKV